MQILKNLALLFFKNPFALYIKHTITIFMVCIKNPTLKIQSGVILNDCSFGLYNAIYEKSSLNNVVLGNFSYIARHSNITQTTIGNFCSIGSNCQIGLGRHPTSKFVSTHPSFYSTLKQCGYTFAKRGCFEEFLPIEIGNDVWIGSNVIIMDGIHIGDGAIIGANSVVTKDVPDYAIVGGVPAKIIKYRFNEDQIKILKKIQWWNWTLDKISRNSHLFVNIDLLI